ncbi:hypothetical protein QNH10_06495 [Sporosarcina thermotolerans]|uniref:hypothetical protein n=1 Tax=Sporosarcina thermotolerans TaxID=633404 RepID=UPI0024BD4862|nr:hypothetical protein [Sporosarcina thermotolerans]WHT49260.1 hypothetical protein QNH10_06495 [Sporosarcina thermotolerans]
MKRKTPLTVEELTNFDLEAANLDVRANADRIYREIFEEYSSVGDTNRNMQPEWVMNARESLIAQQEMVINDLKEKVKQAPVTASDEFMYQDKGEAERELDVAEKILKDIPKALRRMILIIVPGMHCPINVIAEVTSLRKKKNSTRRSLVEFFSSFIDNQLKFLSHVSSCYARWIRRLLHR